MVNRAGDLRVVDLSHFPKTRRQVIWPQQDRVNPVHCHDGLDVFDSEFVFGLHNHSDVFVRRSDIFVEPKAITVCSSQSHTAGTDWRIASISDDLGHHFRSVRLRHDDSLRTQIQHPLDPPLVALRDSDNTRHSVTHSLKNPQDITGIERPVFCVDEQPVESGVRQNLCRRRSRQGDHCPKQLFTCS